MFIADICALLKLLGGEPLPSQLSTRYGGGGKESGWWARFLPSSPQEELLHHSDFKNPARNVEKGMEVPPGWSLFDQKKMMLSLRVTSLASAFLRKRSGGEKSSSSSLMLAIDFDAVALAFVKCAGKTINYICKYV
jgi:hypothetical protein